MTEDERARMDSLERRVQQLERQQRLRDPVGPVKMPDRKMPELSREDVERLTREIRDRLSKDEA